AAVVVTERVAEEVRAVDAAVDRGRLVRVQHHRQHDRDIRVDRQATRHALLGGDQVVVLGYPVRGVLRLGEGERQRPDAAARGQVDRLPAAAGDPQRGGRV